MRTIEPIRVWRGRPWICPCIAIDDFNGDGRPELLLLQSAGAHANSYFDPRIPGGDGYKTGAGDQDLFCLTLADPEGRVLWQIGQPWALERPYSWNGHNSEFCSVVDLDGDGRNELLLVHKGELRVYEGATGRLRASRQLPNEAFTYARPIRTDHSGRWHIFSKSGSSSRTHMFGNPSLLFDHNLELVWEKNDIPGAGHRANFADVDGDGLHEMVIGFGLYDHDGSELWAHPPPWPEAHLDDSVIGDLDGDGRAEIVMACDGPETFVYDLEGRERFRVPLNRGRNLFLGKLLDREPGLQLLVEDTAIGAAERRQATIVGCDGRILNRHFSLGYYQPIRWPNELGPFSFVRCERPVDLSAEFRVMLSDPLGHELARFQVRADFSEHVLRHGLDKIHPEYPAYLGATHFASVGDLDGDGREELVINDRESVWIFRG